MKKTILFIMLISTISCDQSSNCEAFFLKRKNSECFLLVEKKDLGTGGNLAMEGINPFTQEKCDCNEKNRWWAIYRNEIEIGDTIIKRKDELTFNIHKKDTIISHEWECEGKTYNLDGTVKEVLKKQ
ncbi:hypothetical protein EB1_00070 [Empedobacter brevis NBRC 14943 = ATCC 43319]|uniref:Lipoprotein n=1 Tax=Empedobacter brevis NBRC 14943 = ATCC 43319 TaxID=1218108 RepID=A0A511NC90_9FLAO|nr:hypothetical protein [Empedobacter brevis]GEM50217.1 hypothetical protein EB1_00070 [Empedobacter brevis NBRC 14943 = ATCC 43319]